MGLATVSHLLRCVGGKGSLVPSLHCQLFLHVGKKKCQHPKKKKLETGYEARKGYVSSSVIARLLISLVPSSK